MRPEVEAALRRAFPTGRYVDGSKDLWDRHLSDARLERLVGELGNLNSLAVDVERASGPNRAHIVRITRRPAPSWFDFVRLRNSDRPQVLARLGGRIYYWSVLLSRVAPVWMGYWRVVDASDPRGARPVPGSSPAGASAVEGPVREVLLRFGLLELDETAAGERVPWIDADGAGTLESVEDGKPPTVFECLMASD
jgi:hypothetical protein